MSIQNAVADMRNGEGVPFMLHYIRAVEKGKDKPKGAIVVIAKCLYGAPKRGEHTKVTTNKKDTERQSANHVEDGTLPMTNYDAGEYFTPLIGNIIGYNLYKVKH